MNRVAILSAVMFLSLTTSTLAQHHVHGDAGSLTYQGLVNRPIKALSEQQVDDLRNGRGMGLSLPAELNSYPGPKHVLELAEKLALSDEQRARASELFELMKAESMPLGAKQISEEATLEKIFADRGASIETVRSAVTAIGATQAELRFAHLKFHILMAGVLTSDQIRRYAVLRGYESK